MSGRFDEDTYARARRFIEQNEQRAGEGLANEESAPVATPRVMSKPAAPAVPAAPAADVSMGDIPVAPGMRGPAATGQSTSGPSNLDRVLMAAGPGAAMRAAPAVGRGVGALASSAREGWREGEKIKEVARAADRGAKSRADIQAKRGMRQRAEAEAMEKAKPIMQARPAKAKPGSRTRFNEDEAGVNFAKGGSVKGWGKARGARKAKMY